MDSYYPVSSIAHTDTTPCSFVHNHPLAITSLCLSRQNSYGQNQYMATTATSHFQQQDFTRPNHLQANFSQLQPSSSFQQLHYLSTAGSSQIVVLPYPFTLKVKTARIRICQGCRILFQSDCQPPLDIVVRRLKCRPYKHDGVTKTPTAPSNSHYHVNMQCILSADPTFVSHELVISEAVHVYLIPIHKQFLLSALGIVIQ